MQHADTVVVCFAQPDYATAADGNAGLPDVLECTQAVAVSSGSDDLVIKLRRCIEVVVVGVQSCVCQFLCLFFRKHSQGATNLHAHCIHAFHHFEHAVEVAVIAYFPPGGAHAETGGSCFLCFACIGQHFLLFHQCMHFHAS